MINSLDDILYRISDLERRVSNMIRRGTIAEVNLETSKVRVKIGANEQSKILTDWLPWAVSSAHEGVTTWRPPRKGEKVQVVCDSGELYSAVVICGLYGGEYGAPSRSADIDLIKFKDGSQIQYDQKNHLYQITISQSGRCIIEAPGGIKLEASEILATGNLMVKGNITATGDVNAGPISLQKHAHGGVQNGGGKTTPAS